MLTIIGCGNLNRNDDGIGVIVAQQLQQWLQQYMKRDTAIDVQIYDCGTGGMDVMFQARGSTQLIIVDASSTQSEPGALYKVPGEVLEQLPEASYNLHDFRWDHAIAAGKKIFREAFPQEVTVYLVEAADLGLGWDISPVVKQTGDRVVEEIKSVIMARLNNG